LVGVSLLKKLSDELATGVFFIQIQGYPSQKSFTDIFGFENAQPKSRAEEPNREFYLAQVDEIWHGGSTLNTEWGYRSEFVIITWGLRYGIPRAPRGGGSKKSKIFIQKKSKFLV